GAARPAPIPSARRCGAQRHDARRDRLLRNRQRRRDPEPDAGARVADRDALPVAHSLQEIDTGTIASLTTGGPVPGRPRPEPPALAFAPDPSTSARLGAPAPALPRIARCLLPSFSRLGADFSLVESRARSARSGGRRDPRCWRLALPPRALDEVVAPADDALDFGARRS